MRLVKKSNFSFHQITRNQHKIREGFGSFHSQDVEHLIRLPDSQYKIPDIYHEIIERNKFHFDPSIEFGPKMKSKYFNLDPTFNFINHGAFGCSLKFILTEANNWRELCDQQPLKYFDRDLLPLLVYSIRETAKFLNCPPIELFPLPNVTTGLNSIVQNLNLQLGDEILATSLTYGSSKKILNDTATRRGATCLLVDLPLPLLSEDALISKITSSITSKTRLILLDQVTSNTALSLPIQRLALSCRRALRERDNHSALIVVDAAHSMFNQDISIYPPPPPPTHSTSSIPSSTSSTSSSASSRPSPPPSLLPPLSDLVDVWMTNAHKWLCAPRGAAFLWARSETMKHKLRPAIISHGFTSSTSSSSSSASPSSSTSSGYFIPNYSDPEKVLSGFVWDGCRDHSSLLSIPSLLRFWTSEIPSSSSSSSSSSSPSLSSSTQVISMCRNYSRELLREGASLLREEWGIPPCELPAHPSFLQDIQMRLVCVRKRGEGEVKSLNNNNSPPFPSLPFPPPLPKIPLPLFVQGRRTRGDVWGDRVVADKDAFSIQECLFHKHKIEVPIKCLEGRLYVRISAHIYNSIQDFEKLKTIMLKL